MKVCGEIVRRLELATFVLVALACDGVQGLEVPKGNQPANASTSRIRDEATRILHSIKTTEYRHKTDIDEKKGTYYCDCSGFVGYVLNRTLSKDDPKGPLGDKRRRPRAMDYEKAFAALPTKPDGPAKWQRIVRLTDARPGDVIAWRHEKPKPGNTGYIVIVDEQPVGEKDGLVRVVVIDSTTRPQVDDTRAKGTSGIGRGTMWFTIDKEGKPLGYVRGSRTAKPKVEPISIGRALPTSEKREKLPTQTMPRSALKHEAERK